MNELSCVCSGGPMETLAHAKPTTTLTDRLPLPSHSAPPTCYLPLLTFSALISSPLQWLSSGAV